MVRSGVRKFARNARTLFLTAGCLAVLFLSGCEQGLDELVPGRRDRLRVVCTTGLVGDLVGNVGGSRVDVKALMGEGVDPHLYKASPGDVRKLSRADLIVYSGLHLEGKMGEILERLARRKATVSIAEGIDPSRVMITKGGAHDPHLWFDVSLWAEGIDVVREALSTLDPDHAPEYQANAERYRAELQSLHEEARDRLAAIPQRHRVLVTAHDAFGYFGRAYDFEVNAVQGISTESEAGVRELNALVDFLVTRGILAVFVESSVSDRAVRALVEGCRARGHQVIVGGELYSDALGADGTPEGTYVGMVRHNIETIARSLKADS